MEAAAVATYPTNRNVLIKVNESIFSNVLAATVQI